MNAKVPAEITLQELLGIFLQDKWLVVSITLFVTVVAAILAWVQPEKYEATIVVSPVSENTSGRLGGVASQLGGLASLAGLSVNADSMKSETIAFLQSQALTEQYVRQSNLLPVLFAKRWDARNGKWKSGPQRPPTMWQANKLFVDRIRKVVEDKRTGLVKLTISWTDPQLAARWANDLVRITNASLRDKAIAQSNRHIAYLEEQAARTDVAQIRAAIYEVLQSEIKNGMLIRGNDEYALKVIDPAVAPEKRSSPRRTRWVAAGFAGGLLLSVILVLVRRQWRAAYEMGGAERPSKAAKPATD